MIFSEEIIHSMDHQRISDDESIPFIGERNPQSRVQRISACTNLATAWILTVLFGFTSLYLYKSSLECQCTVGSFANGWETDLGRSAIIFS